MLAGIAAWVYTMSMPRYLSYLVFHLTWPALLATACLTGIIWLTQALRFIDFVVSRGLSAFDFLYLTGLMIPALLLVILPVALMLSVLYVYHRLSGDSELVALSAVGLSRLQLAAPVGVVAGTAMLLTYLLALYIMPLANQRFRDIRTYFRDQYASVLLEEDVFNTPLEGLTVYVRERAGNHILRGILIQDNRDEAHIVTMMADEGKVEQGPDGPRFLLRSGQRQELDRKTGSVNWLSFADYALDINFYARTYTRKPDPDERMLHHLFDYSQAAPADIPLLRAEAHQRISWPLYTLGLPLYVLAVMLSGEFNRRGYWKRILFAASSGAAIIMLAFSLRSLAVDHPAVILLMYGCALACIAGPLLVLRSARFLRAPDWKRLFSASEGEVAA